MRRMPSPGLQWGAAESRRRSWKPPPRREAPAACLFRAGTALDGALVNH